MTTHRPVLAIVTAGALALAGCGASGSGGGGGGSGETTSGGSQALFAMSRCMRAHGVPNFPDPTTGSGGGVGLSVMMTKGSPTVTVGGIAFSGPAFTSAEKTCRFGAYGRRPTLTEAQKEGMIKSARCMRAHGVPNFPDPKFGPDGAVMVATGAHINRNSPAFTAAAKACQNVGVGIPGGG